MIQYKLHSSLWDDAKVKKKKTENKMPFKTDAVNNNAISNGQQITIGLEYKSDSSQYVNCVNIICLAPYSFDAMTTLALHLLTTLYAVMKFNNQIWPTYT